MLLNSNSIVYFSLFPSISNPDCASTPTTVIRAFSSSKRNPVPFPFQDGSAKRFLQNNNTVADFIRFKSGIDGGGAELQTAVVSYKKKFPWYLLRPFFQVDLVSTIHIADKEYFLTLQNELEPYDCVLYEMVASRESLESRRNPAVRKRFKRSSSRGFNSFGCMQQQMARIFMLDFQLDCLNYQAANWYHADLDYETFRLLQLKKGESFFSFARDMTLRFTKTILQPSSVQEDLGAWRSKLLWALHVLPMPLVAPLVIRSICTGDGSQESEYSEIEALLRFDFSAAMKVFLAKRLTSWFTQVTSDIEVESVIIGERNRAAMRSLRATIDEGCNKIAILYGSGHMPDLGRRLREEFDLVPSRVQWITAWSIRKRDLNATSFPFLKTMTRISGWPLNRYQTLGLLIFLPVLALDIWFWKLFFGTAVNLVSQVASQLHYSVDNAHVM